MSMPFYLIKGLVVVVVVVVIVVVVVLLLLFWLTDSTSHVTRSWA